MAKERQQRRYLHLPTGRGYVAMTFLITIKREILRDLDDPFLLARERQAVSMILSSGDITDVHEVRYPRVARQVRVVHVACVARDAI